MAPLLGGGLWARGESGVKSCDIVLLENFVLHQFFRIGHGQFTFGWMIHVILQYCGLWVA